MQLTSMARNAAATAQAAADAAVQAAATAQAAAVAAQSTADTGVTNAATAQAAADAAQATASAAQTSGQVDTKITTHAGVPAAHHAKYTDGEADLRVQAAKGTAPPGNTPGHASGRVWDALGY